MRQKWATLEKDIDPDIFSRVQEKLAIQEKDAAVWRDTCLDYFQKFSKMPIPEYN